MKLKLGIICGILIWIITSFFTGIFNPIFNSNLPHVNIITPIIIIITTVFFGIIYIRSIESNEVVEGIGIVYIVIDIILDTIFFIIPNWGKSILQTYPAHIISISILTLLITTFLGYLSQMNIDLK